MTNDLIKIAKDLPLGFFTVKNEDGKIEEVKTKLDGGDLSTLINEYFKNRFRYNLLELKLEFDKKPLEVGIDKLLYIQLQQLGYSVGQQNAMNSLLYVAKQNNYHPIVEFLENIEKDENIESADIDKISTDY